MGRHGHVSTLAALAAAMLMAGCGGPSSPQAEEGAAAASSAVVVQAASSAPASPSTVASGVSVAAGPLPGDHAETRRYRIDITYPALPASAATLDSKLHATGAQAKREFMRGLPDPDRFPEFADRQLALKIDFSVAAQMPRFISVREQGMADTGGAHPIPIDGTFVYDTSADTVIGLTDLFTRPQEALQRLSKLSRADLEKKLLAKVPGGARTPEDARREWEANMREMIHGGTEPEPRNFSGFVVLAGAGDRASGLQLVFSPYQVAPYVYGTQTVDVPVDAFADLLKPSYRDAFDGADAGS